MAYGETVVQMAAMVGFAVIGGLCFYALIRLLDAVVSMFRGSDDDVEHEG